MGNLLKMEWIKGKNTEGSQWWLYDLVINQHTDQGLKEEKLIKKT